MKTFPEFEEKSIFEGFLLVAGSLMVSLSGPIIGLYSFEGAYFGVLLGVIVFNTGYRIFQAGALGDIPKFRISGDSVSTGFFALLGLSAAAFGLMSGALATKNLEVLPMIYSGIFMVIGYIVAHSAEKQELI